MESSELKRSTPPPAAPGKGEHHEDAVKEAAPPLSPTSSSSDDDDDDKRDAGCSSPSHKSKKPPIPKAEGSSTQAPPKQEMERCPSGSGYRIPASVFERNKSSAAGDWSVASNESLFSIHINDQYMWRSGELAPADNQMFCYSAHSSTGGAADMRSRELGLAEATMLEVIKENEGRTPPPNARRSAGSNQSNMSFAFSVAGGDTERIPSSIKSSASRTRPDKNPDAEHDESHVESVSPAAKEKEQEKHKAAAPRSKCLFCCPCFSFCYPAPGG